MYVGGIEGGRAGLLSGSSKGLDNTFSDYLRNLQENSQVNGRTKEDLRKKYSNLSFNVGDASKFKNWDRFDFPVSALFKENVNIDELANWTPVFPDTLPNGFEDYIQKDLDTIPLGSHSVMIHSEVQAKMDGDPNYAKKIYEKIDIYFQKDIMINESILPGSTKGMIQFVSIDIEGNIGRTCTIGEGGEDSERVFSPSGKGRRKISPALLTEIKNTYGEKYFDPGKYMIHVSGDMETTYCIEQGVYGELLRRKSISNL